MDVYRNLAAGLSNGSLGLDDLPTHLSNIPCPTNAEATTLLMEAVECSHITPRDGWALAAIVHETTCHSENVLLRAQSTLALAKVLINWERFNQALQVLDDAHAYSLSAFPSSTYLLASFEWLHGLALARLAHADQAAQVLTQAGILLHQCDSISQDKIMLWQCDLARVEMMLAHYDQALVLAQASLDYFHSQPEISSVCVAQCQLAMATVYYSRGHYPQALECLESSIVGFAAWPTEQLRAQVIMAQVYERQMHFPKTAALCKQLQSALEQLDLPASLARCDNTLGMAYFNQGDLAIAKSYFERARAGFLQAGVYAFAADSELNLGRVLHKQGDFRAAIAQHQRACDLYQKDKHTMLAARCEHNIGQCYREMGDYSRALDYFNRARETFEKLKVRTDLAICYHNLAFTNLLLGESGRAAEYLDLALTRYEEIGLSLYAAECYTELALITSGQGHHDLALSQIYRARQICTEADYAPGIAVCDQAEGDVLSNAKQYQSSIEHYQKAIQTFNRCGQLLDVALCDLGVATVYFELGDLVQAQTHLDRTVVILDERVPDITWQAEALRSHLAESHGSTEKALETAIRSVTHLSNARRSLADENLVHIFLNAPLATSGSRSRIYNRAISLALQTHHFDQALQAIEERRAQLFANHLRWPMQLAANTSRLDELIRRRLCLQTQITELRGMLQPGFSAALPVETDESNQTRARALDRLQVLAREYEQVIIEARNAGWSALESLRDTPPFSLDLFYQAMKQVWPDRGWICLCYAWLDDDLVIVHLNDRGDLDITQPQLSSFDWMALQMMSQPDTMWRGTLYLQPGSSGEMYRRRAYDVLIPPTAQRDLSPDRLLFVIPSGLLYSVPFAALQAGNTFLTQQTLLCTSPSLQAMTLLHARRPQRSRHNRLLAVAVDTFAGNIPSLPFVRDEVAALSQLWSGETEIVQNDAATLATFQQLSDSGSLLNYRMIHFATHAVYDGEYGRLSRLLLQDGSLFVDDIRSLRLAADLVVLSACQTGLSHILSGDEMIGLTYSFLAAGAQTVVASLWHVNDSRAKSLMEHFYSVLGKDILPARALASAQRSAIANGWPPYFWASFLPVGLP